MTRDGIIQALDGTHPTLGRAVALGIDVLIMMSAMAIAIETIPSLPSIVHKILRGFEMVLLGVFTTEYILRITLSRKRLSYIFSFWGLVDFLSVLPAILMLTPEWQAVRALRLIRLARLLKLFRASTALDRLVEAFMTVRAELAVFGIFSGLMLYVSSVGIYLFEHEAQPEIFTSIPESMWWAVATFTTVGYGDMVPVTAGGRIFTTFVLFLGLGIIAVPAAIVTTALLESEHSLRRRGLDPDTPHYRLPRHRAAHIKHETKNGE